MIRLPRAVLILFGLLLSLGGMALGILLASPAPAEIRLQPCPTEDSANCYWDADSMGNGLGRDFIDLNGVLYVIADLPTLPNTTLNTTTEGSNE